MGAQGKDKQSGSYDPEAASSEGPVHEVVLSAFFLSKYEMTQGQWVRSAGWNRSSYPQALVHRGRQRVPLQNPVEQVSWDECDRELSRLGLMLPTEAQWEYGCRGGKSTVWWPGQEREELLGAANLADRSAAKGGATWQALKVWPGTDSSFLDGYVVHAPVGNFRANGFGLHDVHGNVYEWCRDWIAGYETRPRAGDGLRGIQPARARMLRGGGFDSAARDARSALRLAQTPESRSGNLGARPSRVIATN